MRKRGKKAAFEMSIGTMVIIVLAITMLILGLVLVRNIFGGATESIDILKDKTMAAVAGLFTDEGEDVIVKLGADNIAKIKPGSGSFGIAVGARTLDGSATTRERLNYKLTLDQSSGQNCISVLDQEATKNLFITSLDTDLKFDRYSEDKSFSIVRVDVPKGTARCSQKVFIDVVDTQTAAPVGGNFFEIEVVRGGLF